MRAVILAGGKGTRLHPYTLVLPKPLMPIGDLAILEIVLLQLASRGFTRVTMAVGYLAELIRAVVGDGRRYGLAIDYSHEAEPLGTAGPIGLIPDLSGTFLVMNGDILSDIDAADLVARHRAAGAACTMAVFRKDVKIDLGVLDIDGERVVGYTEKPTLSYSVSSGIYAFDARALAHLPRGRRFDLPDLVRALIAASEPVAAYRFDGTWLDMGTPVDYARATELFLSRREQFLPGGRKPAGRA
jgi:NDP-sugar pyrophosphorylase family protein